MKLKVDDRAPDFSLLNQDGEYFNLSDHLEKDNVLVYFYPKDETPGCIKEACTFRDSMDEFKSLNCTVVGISGDNLSSHQRFANKYDLTFSILSDPKNRVRRLYGVKAAIPGILPGRKTYLINKAGNIAHISEYQFKPLLHIKEALKALQNVH